MKVADRNLEEEPAKETERRISEISMDKWHRPGSNSALEPISHHEVGAAAQLIKVLVEAREIIAIVGVAHDDIAAASSFNSPEQRRAITTGRNVH